MLAGKYLRPSRGIAALTEENARSPGSGATSAFTIRTRFTNMASAVYGSLEKIVRGGIVALPRSGVGVADIVNRIRDARADPVTRSAFYRVLQQQKRKTGDGTLAAKNTRWAGLAKMKRINEGATRSPRRW
jgi:hypothetical protein